MKDKRVAITGGAGFIGSNLAEELASNNDVIIIDDLSTGKKENILGSLSVSLTKIVRSLVRSLHILAGKFSLRSI